MIYFKQKYMLNILKINIFIGDWGLGMGDLGIGDWADYRQPMP